MMPLRSMRMKIEFTTEEVLLIRQLISDRIENRFETASVAASAMNRKTLRGCADEIERLESLKERMTLGGEKDAKGQTEEN